MLLVNPSFKKNKENRKVCLWKMVCQYNDGVVSNELGENSSVNFFNKHAL